MARHAPAIPGIDTAEGLARIGGDGALYLRLLCDFRDQLDAFAGAFRSAFDHGEAREAKRLVQALAAVSGTLGARSLSDAALAVEAEVGETTFEFGRLEPLMAIIAELLPGLRACTAEAALPSIAPPEASETLRNAGNQRVLVVDDNPANIDLLHGILREHYKVLAARNGQAALRLAATEPRPDLILLDVMMPELDGYEVCRRLKLNADTADIPVIFVTAAGATVEQVLGLSLGAVDYVLKPVNPDLLLARVRSHLALREASHKVAALSRKLSRYISPQIAQSLVDGTLDAKLHTRRRKITVFFSDLVGFTRSTERLDPEDLAYVLNTYLTRMSELCLGHGGTLDKLIGDGVMAFFGDPVSHGLAEDAQRCLEMALAMHAAMPDLEASWRRRGINLACSVRMGISTGFCTVGNFGSEDRLDYTAIGRHVNLAARLESQAPPDCILISEQTWALVNDRFRFRSHAAIDVRGFDDPIRVYEVDRSAPLDDPGQAEISEAVPGFTLELNTQALGEGESARIRRSLEQALALIEATEDEGSEGRKTPG